CQTIRRVLIMPAILCSHGCATAFEGVADFLHTRSSEAESPQHGKAGEEQHTGCKRKGQTQTAKCLRRLNSVQVMGQTGACENETGQTEAERARELVDSSRHSPYHAFPAL